MQTLTTDGSGVASGTVPTNPGKRYALVWYKGAGLAAGTLTPFEVADGVSVGFMSAPIGGSAITWDLSSIALGRIEFPATQTVFRLAISGGTADKQLFYDLVEIR